MRNFLILLLAITIGLLAGYIDWRSDEVQAVVLVLFMGSVITGYLHPHMAWFFALVSGVTLTLSHVIAYKMGYEPYYTVDPNPWESLFGIIPAIIGAYIGVLISYLAASMESTEDKK